MTLIYVPRLIESAEQAESLPVGTIAAHDEHWPVERCTPNRWESSARDMNHEEMIGWFALIPIEAEEEFSAENSWGGRDLTSTLDSAQADAEMHGTAAQTRLVTPWEEQS